MNRGHIVSALYRFAPSNAVPDDWERVTRRMKAILRRLVAAHGLIRRARPDLLRRRRRRAGSGQGQAAPTPPMTLSKSKNPLTGLRVPHERWCVCRRCKDARPKDRRWEAAEQEARIRRKTYAREARP